MALRTRVKSHLNRVLALANLRIDTLTIERAEQRRLAQLDASGHFRRQAFPVADCMARCDGSVVFTQLGQYCSRLADFEDPAHNRVGFGYANPWYSSPDAEVLYTIMRTFEPRRVVEVGSGNSTKLFRLAIDDGGLKTRLLSIDPNPRNPVGELADEFVPASVEALDWTEVFEPLQSGDIVFIDSSHEVVTGNDVVYLYLTVLPRLPVGTLIHIHDIFLPDEYPREWILNNRWGWNEQYIVQAMLASSDRFEVLWASHYLHSIRPDFALRFPHSKGQGGASLWLRKLT